MAARFEPYAEQLARARRWDKAVDFGSPMTAWTPEMFREYRAAQIEKRQPSMANCKRTESTK